MLEKGLQEELPNTTIPQSPMSPFDGRDIDHILFSIIFCIFFWKAPLVMEDHLLWSAISYIFQWPLQFVKRPVIKKARVSEKIILCNHKNVYMGFMKNNLLCISLICSIAKL